MSQLRTPPKRRPIIDLDDESDHNNSDSNRRDLLRKSIIRVKKPNQNFQDTEAKSKAKFTTKQYFGENKKLIEDFFVIGADLNDISLSKAKACPEVINIKSKILYMFSD